MAPAHDDRRRRRAVRVADGAARVAITIGGLGTIAAVLLVCLFLAWVVVPLFVPGHIEKVASRPAAGLWPTATGAPIHLELNEYTTAGIAVFADGHVVMFALDTGERIASGRVTDDAPASSAFVLGTDKAVFGYADGTIRFASIGFETDYLPLKDSPALADLPIGSARVQDGAIVERTAPAVYRAQSLAVDVQEASALAETAIVLVDRSERPSGPIVAALDATGRLYVRAVRERRNLLTGETVTTLTGGDIQVEHWDAAEPPMELFVSGAGDAAYVIWEGGELRRFNIDDIARPFLAETIDVIDVPGGRVTAIRFLAGKTTLLVGDAGGRVRAWFPVLDPQAPDGSRVVNAHTFAGPAPVTSLAAAPRERVMAAGYANGTIRVMQVTSEERIGKGQFATRAPVGAMAIAPRGDVLMAVSGGVAGRWAIDAPHAGITLESIFLPVWYEGYPAPAHVWQSSSASEAAEPKLGLTPLIFGTIKATIYSMIIAVPLALMAAVFTSEFMRTRTRARIKPAIEMMASLPSVVLGFLAAIVIAPVVENIVMQVLVSLVTVPFVVLLGAYMWQMLPRTVSSRFRGVRLWIIACLLPIGVGLAIVSAPPVEAMLFVGDIKAWLAGQRGAPTGGWMLLVLPCCAACAALVVTRVVTPALRRTRGGQGPTATMELVKFLCACACTLGLALGVSWLLGAIGFDPRGEFVGTYVHRNALIVGVAMGFAVIPIIYTIAEDALSSVPEHLRAASLGAGATPWQTTMRIVVPAAMSGIFSAVMIGLGRAVGETMIVLMAAGNTPILSWNIFNGFRTLSANIAVELPEAVRGSTHYRMLFLAGLVLFLMTFILNTIAELVRMRFRKRAVQL